MLATEEILQPITPENPCGEDLSYDAALQTLETEFRGKAETQFSPAEDPHWPTVLDQARSLFARSKDLRVALIYCVASLQLEGVMGVRKGLAIIHGLVERYWDTLYPKLDPEDNNDPLERINILSGLVMPPGSYEDPLNFLERLRQAPLCKSPRMGTVNLAIMAGDKPGETTPTPAHVQATFRDTDPEVLSSIYKALADSLITVRTLSDTIDRKVGSGHSINWAPLIDLLGQMEKSVAPFVAGAETPVAGEVTAGEVSQAGVGAIRSRQDVIHALERICDFYSHAEPSSPVPLLLRRAQRIANMNFMEIVQDLSPDALAQVRVVTGEPP